MFIVGRIIGVNALASVGCTGSITYTVLGFAGGVGTGLSILTAQRFGARDDRGLRRSFAVGAKISAAVAVVMTVVTVPASRKILEIMNTPAEIIDGAHAYLLVIFSGIFASMLFNFLSQIIRALGDSRTPLVFLMVSCVINIALVYILICGVGMGVAGAALATVIAQVISGLLCIGYIWKKVPVLRIQREDWRSVPEERQRHIRLSLPLGLQMSIIGIGIIAVQVVLNKLGATSVAAFTVATRIELPVGLVLSSFGAASATYVAQNYGAGLTERIRRGVKQCCLMALSFSTAMGFVNWFAGYRLAGLFVGGSVSQVQLLAQTYLRINAPQFWALALLHTFRNTLSGLGNGALPMAAGMVELLMRVCAAVFLVERIGFIGVCWAAPLAWIGSCVSLGIGYALTTRKMMKREFAN
jgi:putative MATE family efflux protein